MKFLRLLAGTSDPIEQKVTDVPRLPSVRLASEMIDEISPFSVDEVSSILYNAENGKIGELWRYYSRMQTIDPFLGGLVTHLRSAVAQQPLRRVYPENSTYTEEWESFLSTVFETLNFRNVIYHLVDAHLQGAAILKIDWKITERFGRPWAVPASISRVPYTAVEMITDATDEFYGELAVVMAGGDRIPTSKLDPRFFIFVEAEPGRARYHMIGAMRRVLSWFVAKQIVHRSWVDYIQIYAHPYRIGRLPAVAPQQLRSIVREAVEKVAPNGWAILPDGADIEFKEVNRSGTVTVYRDLIDYVHQQYAIALIGSADIVGDNREGSYARLKISNSIRYEFIRNVAAVIEEGMTDLVRKMIELNFKNANPLYYPRVRLRVNPPTDMLEMARTIETLSRAGYIVDRGYVSDLFGFPLEDGGSSES